MKKSSAFALSFILLLVGIITGFLLSPVKHGIGNHSGNNFRFCKGDIESESEDEFEEEE